MKQNLNNNVLSEMANAIRTLSIDAIQKANSGHPGLPLGLADVATVLFKYYLKFDVNNPKWPNRDRFILSAGHGSMLLYALSYLTGYRDTNLKQIKDFRKLGSKTAGHPEYGLLDCVETTTGPLGQGLANAVGMAISEKVLNQKFGSSIIDHKTWVVVGDGCLMEGISQEAISIAGHMNLNKLIVLFDDNGISIDGVTSLTTSDNQLERFKACNWNAISIDGHNYDQIYSALKASQKSNKPTLIACKTIIGYGSPNKSGKSVCHGAPLGEEEVKRTKDFLNCKNKSFFVPNNILNLWRKIGNRNKKIYAKWKARVNNSKYGKDFLRQIKKSVYKRKPNVNSFLKNIIINATQEATRKSSQNALELLFNNSNNLLGGSADLTGSNLTKVSHSKTKGKNTNYLYYGVREHIMAAAMNGISLHGAFIPYGGTFLIFSDYCKNSIRLSALMKQQVIYVFTHDSIGLGEDGPTHQPIEQLAGLRAIPNLRVLRPCDAIETFECWEIALMHKNSPTVLALSRQSVPLLRNDYKINKSVKGAYIIKKSKKPLIKIISTGSEVSLAVNVFKNLSKLKISSEIISMPSMELFEAQNEAYKRKVLGDEVKVIIEAASDFGWHKYINGNGKIFSVNSFGESGKGEDLYTHFGLNADVITKKIVEEFFR